MITERFEAVAAAMEDSVPCSVCDACERTYPESWIIDNKCPFCGGMHNNECQKDKKMTTINIYKGQQDGYICTLSLINNEQHMNKLDTVSCNIRAAINNHPNDIAPIDIKRHMLALGYSIIEPPNPDNCVPFDYYHEYAYRSAEAMEERFARAVDAYASWLDTVDHEDIILPCESCGRDVPTTWIDDNVCPFCGNRHDLRIPAIKEQIRKVIEAGKSYIAKLCTGCPRALNCLNIQWPGSEECVDFLRKEAGKKKRGYNGKA